MIVIVVQEPKKWTTTLLVIVQLGLDRCLISGEYKLIKCARVFKFIITIHNWHTPFNSSLSQSQSIQFLLFIYLIDN